MGELREEYEGRVAFVVVPAAETAQRNDEIEAFGFSELKHGLVGFDRWGEALVTMPGHRFGKPEIEQAIGRLLASD